MDLQQEIEEQTPNILQMLHYDELLIIFSFLDVPDLINVEKVCQRFSEAAEQIYKSFKLYDFTRDSFWNLTIPEGMAIASRVGPYVETLTFGSNSVFCELWTDANQVAELLSTYFTKLKKIKILGTLTENCTRKMALALRTLEDVELEQDGDGFSNYDDAKLASLFRLEQLNSLKVQDCYGLSGKFLKELSNITVLNLNYVYGIDPQLFIQFCEKHPNLRSLNLFGCKWIDTMCLSSMAENLKNLEELSVSDGYMNTSPEDYFVLANLTKLKHIGISGYHQNEEKMFELLSRISARNQLESLELEDFPISEYAKNALKNLKSLNLWGSAVGLDDSTINTLSCENTLQRLILSHNIHITSHGLAQLIAKCPFIKFIKIEDCDKIDKSFIHQIIPHLKERSHMLKLEMKGKGVLLTKEEFGNYVGVNSSRLMLINKLWH